MSNSEEPESIHTDSTAETAHDDASGNDSSDDSDRETIAPTDDLRVAQALVESCLGPDRHATLRDAARIGAAKRALADEVVDSENGPYSFEFAKEMLAALRRMNEDALVDDVRSGGVTEAFFAIVRSIMRDR